MTKTNSNDAATPSRKSQCDIDGVLNDKEGSCVTQHLPNRVAVTYEVNFDQALRLPYAFHWNGVKQPEGKVLNSTSTKVLVIRALVKQGEKVGIYLGSDASPEFRKELLYPVTVGANDVRVVITTKKGKYDGGAEAKLVKQDVATPHGDKEDQYGGVLTGDIWMRFSHRYSAAEAADYLKQAGETDSGVVAAITEIYGGSVTKQAGFSVAFDNNQGVCKVSFQILGTDTNCTDNIKAGYDFGREGLPRVHPRTWIAFLQAARDSKVTVMEVSSGWRPMLGSATHRIGLGLDIKTIKSANGTAVFDRTNNTLWASEEEKTAHAEWVQSEKDLDAATVEQKNARDGLKKAQGEEGVKEAKERDVKASKDVTDVTDKRDKAKGYFKDKHEGALTDRFEQALIKNPLVRQIFDPLVMDDNTQDKIEPKANRNQTANETTHKNHLHIAARDRYLAP